MNLSRRLGILASLLVVAWLILEARFRGPTPTPSVQPAPHLASRAAPPPALAPTPLLSPATPRAPLTGPEAKPSHSSVATAPVPAATPFLAFDQWLARQASLERLNDDALQEGIQLAKLRRTALRQLIESDPGRALKASRTLAWSTRTALPATLAEWLEEPVSGTGRFEVLCAQTLPHTLPLAAKPASPWQRTFTLGDRTFRAFVYGRRTPQMTTEHATFHGIVVDDAFAVSDEAVRVVDPAETAALIASGDVPRQSVCMLTGVAAEGAPGGLPVLVQHGRQWLALASESLIAPLNSRLAAVESGFRPTTEPPTFQQWSHGVKRLLFMRARFPDDLREPISEADAAEVMRLANEHFVESSFNSLSILSTIGPLVMLPQPKLYYAVKGPGALLQDARAATRLAGIDPTAFDMDVVRFESVPGFNWAGLGSVGGPGAWLQSSALGVVVHELGHNLGLSHANFWNTVRPEPPTDTQNTPFDADSLVGIDSIFGAGDDIEYGDPFDVMGGGGGDAHFSGLHKVLLGWVPDAGLQTITTNGTYRVAAHDLGVLSPIPQALRVRKDAERFYWISARGSPGVNAWHAQGVELHWNNWHQAISSAQLLDATPGSGLGKADAPIALGRTFVDYAAQIFITPLTRQVIPVGERSVPTYEVAVRFGPFPTNRPPQLELAEFPLTVAPDEQVSLHALASDPDGDSLTYFWDMGRGEPGPLGADVVHAWNDPGEYVVRCEVSDLKGGFAAKHVVVRVGAPNRLRISGRVIDHQGQPLLGVRIHNGRYETNSPYAADFRWTYTDSDGRYTLTDLLPGDYEIGGELAGTLVRPMNFVRPLRLDEFTGVDVDFFATEVPRVTVTQVADGTEGAAPGASFRITRSGSTGETLRVFFRTTGTAEPGKDYTAWKQVEVQTNVIDTALAPVRQPIEYGYVDLAPGVSATNLLFPVLPDTSPEVDESLVVTLHYPVTRTITSETETNIFDLPGWQILPDNGPNKWFQIRQAYQLGARAEASAVIRDSSPSAASPRISIAALDPDVSENAGDSASFVLLRTGRVPAETLRIPIVVSGKAIAGDDYEALPAEIEMPPGVEALRIPVRVLDDRYVEGNESLVVTLGTGTGYVLGTSTASITVVDNDLAFVSVTSVDPVIDESAPAPGARVTFQRLGDRSAALEIDYLLSGTAGSGVDYLALPGRITIPAGQSTATLFVVPIDDADLETNETVEIRIGDSPAYNPASPSRATVVLRDDESPIVTVDASDPDADESSADPGAFRIRRTGSTAGPLIVRYRFGGSAVHQADFVASGDRIVIPAGQTSAFITVTPIDDLLREDPEEIALELLPDPAYTLGTPARAAVALTDSGDSLPAVGFALLSSSAPESLTNPAVALRISGNPDEGPTSAVTVDWEVIGGSATQGRDYVLTNGTVSFAWTDPESETPLTNRVGFIPLQILDDLLPEADETVLIRLRIAPTVIPADDPEQPPTLVTNGVVDVFAIHTFTILDDDQSQWSVTAPERSTSEGSSTPARFTIRRTGRTNLTQAISFHLSGLAAAGSDYLAVTNGVVLAPGETSADVLISPVDDPLMEPRENVVLSLIHSPGGRILSPGRAEVFISDNDGTLEFANPRWTALEGDGEAPIRIVRSGDISLPASAFLEIIPLPSAPGAEVGTDHGAVAATNLLVQFPAGSVEAVVPIPLADDDLPEPSDFVNLRLSRGSDLFPLGGQNTAVLTVVDDDALLSTGTNGVAGIESTGLLRVALERSGPLDEPLALLYQTEDFQAIAGLDYLATSGRLEFPAGAKTALIQVELLDDTLLEGDEVLLVRLATLEGLPVSAVRAFIVDDDCTLEFATTAVSTDEDVGVVELQVVRTGSTLNPVLVDFATQDGSALRGSDFEAAAGSLRLEGNRFETLTNGTGAVVFRAGETNKTLLVRIYNDSEGEQDETFQVSLAAARNAPGGEITGSTTLGFQSTTAVTIRDNESPGRVDDAFQPGLGADAPVRALALQPDGKLLVGGDFATFDGLILPRLARLHADGFVDNSFNPGTGFDGTVLAVAIEPNGRIFVGGTFTRVDGAEARFLTRLEPDGTRSEDFNAAPDGPIRAFAADTSAESDLVYVGGDFVSIAGRRLGGVARFHGTGTLDPTFTPAPEPRRSVQALAAIPWPDGERLLVGGSFSNWSGTGARFLIRLLPDGAPDPAWGAERSPDGPVLSLAVAPDARVYVAGTFRNLAGAPRAGIARLLVDGTLDPTFDPGAGANAAVLAVAPHMEDHAVMAGAFTEFNTLPVARFTRLNGDASVDTDFFGGQGANDVVRALAVQPDGAVLLGGDFTEVQGRPRLRVARVHGDEKFSEGFIEFTQSPVVVRESEASATLTVRRSGSGKTAARIRYRSLDDSARQGEDYSAVDGELVFDPGVTERQLTVPLRDDLLAEGAESFRVTLTNAVGALPGRQSIATVVIEDNESAVAFATSEARVTEAAGLVSLQVLRSGPTGNEAQVLWRTEPDTARDGEDFTGGSGRLVFTPGQESALLEIPILDDAALEPVERFTVRLEPVDAGIPVGSLGVQTVLIEDDDQPATHFNLTVERSPGGTVLPASGRFPANDVVEVRAIPAPGFEFARWEGTVASANNPLALRMNRNHLLTARFRARSYLETFESGSFVTLPWQLDTTAPWIVTSDSASSGKFSARSGTILDNRQSTLTLVRETPAGGGSFDFRTSSEAGWDFLEFHLNGVLVMRWSGIQGWQTYTFDVPAGINRFEWSFRRDRTFGETADAVWIDNLDLPEAEEPIVVAPILLVRPGEPGCALAVRGTPGRLHALERSTDLQAWTPVATTIPDTEAFSLTDPDCSASTPRFYRVRAE